MFQENLRELKRVVWKVALVVSRKKRREGEEKAGKKLRPGGGKQTALGPPPAHIHRHWGSLKASGASSGTPFARNL